VTQASGTRGPRGSTRTGRRGCCSRVRSPPPAAPLTNRRPSRPTERRPLPSSAASPGQRQWSGASARLPRPRQRADRRGRAGGAHDFAGLPASRGTRGWHGSRGSQTWGRCTSSRLMATREPVQDREAAHEIKPVPQVRKRERVHPTVLNARIEQAVDRAEPSSAFQLDSPSSGDHNTARCRPPTPFRATMVGQKRVEAVECAVIQDARPGEVRRQEREPVAVIARRSGRVDPSAALSAKV